MACVFIRRDPWLSKFVSRKAKPEPGECGPTLEGFMAKAPHEKPAHDPGVGDAVWMEGFGGLRRVRSETARAQARIEEAFERIEPEDRA
jgi:hypothetical protein